MALINVASLSPLSLAKNTTSPYVIAYENRDVSMGLTAISPIIFIIGCKMQASMKYTA